MDSEITFYQPSQSRVIPSTSMDMFKSEAEHDDAPTALPEDTPHPVGREEEEGRDENTCDSEQENEPPSINGNIIPVQEKKQVGAENTPDSQ